MYIDTIFRHTSVKYYILYCKLKVKTLLYGYGYRCGKKPKEQVGVVLVVDREVTGVADYVVRQVHFGHPGQLLGPEYVAVAQVRCEKQWFGRRMGRRGLGIPQRIRTPQV